jgi:hypothetical protein
VHELVVLLIYQEAQLGWKIKERRALFFCLGLLGV